MATRRKAISSAQVAGIMADCLRSAKEAKDRDRHRIAKTLEKHAHQLSLIAPLYKQTAMSAVVVSDARNAVKRWHSAKEVLDRKPI